MGNAIHTCREWVSGRAECRGKGETETPSHTAAPEAQMAYSACHPSSLFQGYHRSNHFIATQGEYPSKAVVRARAWAWTTRTSCRYVTNAEPLGKTTWAYICLTVAQLFLIPTELRFPSENRRGLPVCSSCTRRRQMKLAENKRCRQRFLSCLRDPRFKVEPRFLNVSLSDKRLTVLWAVIISFLYCSVAHRSPFAWSLPISQLVIQPL